MSKRRISILEQRIANVLDRHKFPSYKTEFRFHPTRMWRFDFAWPDLKIAIEGEGGIWTRGAHTRGNHFNSDCEKYNSGVTMGWKIFRYTTDTIYQIPDDFKALGVFIA